MSSAAQYYQPYDSGTDPSSNDSGDGSSDESDDDMSSTEDVRIRREQDPRYAILRAPGPNLSTNATQLKYMENAPIPGAPWDSSTNISSLKNYTYLQPPKTTKTSLVSFKSINRDRKLYPTPFYFQLKLPRVYKNVTKFQLVQMSFPNSSNSLTQDQLYNSTITQILLDAGIPSTCISTCTSIMNCTPSNTSMGMIEQGRIMASGTPLMTTLSVPSATYESPQLAQELTAQSNNTPPLNIIPYSTFYDTFTNTRDSSVLFNEPGDVFFSATNNIRYGAHTKENIMNTYYTQQHIDALPSITDQVAFIAYYFPVLKEAIATQKAEAFIQCPTGMAFSDIVTAVMGPFQGLNSDVYYAICSVNQGVLDSYRKTLTFELRNINNYKWSYNAKEQRFMTVHDTLHKSLQKDLSKNYQSQLNNQLALNGLTPQSFTTLKSNLVTYSCIASHLEKNLSSVLGAYHLMSCYKYAGDMYHSTLHAIDDLDADPDFTTMFHYTSSIGRLYGNYNGTIMHFSSFMDYHSTLSSYYTLVQSTTQQITSIHTAVQTNYHNYVSNKYDSVLPSEMIRTQSYMSNQAVPVSFVTNQALYAPGMLLATDLTNVAAAAAPSGPDCNTLCCKVLTTLINNWYNRIPVNTIIGTLTYRLGLINMTPNTFNIFSTIAAITSTGNMNYLMSINDEQGFNNMDIVMPENNAITTETTGQVKLMAAKILMGNVGDTGVSQTLIQNPSIFENNLGKLDRVTIKIYNDDNQLTPSWLYLPFTLSISEWDATFQIDEEIGFMEQNKAWSNVPTIPLPDNPNAMPYLGYVPKNGPNNT